MRLSLLVDQGDSAQVVPPSVLHALAAEVVAARVDLVQYSETYYFHDGPPESLACVLPATVAVAGAATRAGDPARALAGQVLLDAVDALVEVLERRYLGSRGSREAALEAYRTEHQQR